jgi:hypothetical protein
MYIRYDLQMVPNYFILYYYIGLLSVSWVLRPCNGFVACKMMMMMMIYELAFQKLDQMFIPLRSKGRPKFHINR